MEWSEAELRVKYHNFFLTRSFASPFKIRYAEQFLAKFKWPINWSLYLQVLKFIELWLALKTSLPSRTFRTLFWLILFCQVCRKEPLPETLRAKRAITSVLVINVAEEDAEIERISSLFKEFGRIQQMRIVPPGRKLPVYLHVSRLVWQAPVSLHFSETVFLHFFYGK